MKQNRGSRMMKFIKTNYNFLIKTSTKLAICLGLNQIQHCLPNLKEIEEVHTQKLVSLPNNESIF